MTDLEKAAELSLFGDKAKRTDYVLESHKTDDYPRIKILRMFSAGETFWNMDNICYYYYPDEYTRTKTLLIL